jgi:hypothetical protein
MGRSISWSCFCLSFRGNCGVYCWVVAYAGPRENTLLMWYQSYFLYDFARRARSRQLGGKIRTRDQSGQAVSSNKPVLIAYKLVAASVSQPRLLNNISRSAEYFTTYKQLVSSKDYKYF